MRDLSNLRILLLDDDPTTHTIVKGVLDKDKVLLSCFTIAEAIAVIESGDTPSLFIIDRVLPDGDGITVCTKIRANDRTKDIPIIFLSGKDTETDKVGGLFAGADDYITKPASPLELKARIQARLRTNSKTIVLGSISVDLATHRAFVATDGSQKEIELTRIEFKMLVTLLQAPDRVFSRDLLLTAVWGASANLSDRVVDTHLSHLRKKLNGADITIEAIRGEGYRLIPKNTPKRQAA